MSKDNPTTVRNFEIQTVAEEKPEDVIREVHEEPKLSSLKYIFDLINTHPLKASQILMSKEDAEAIYQWSMTNMKTPNK